MARRHEPQPTPSITWGNIIGWFASPMLFGAIFVVGQWALMGESTKKSAEDIRLEKAEREKMRDNFLTSQGKLIEVLGKIDARLSVTEKQQELGNRQLEKLNDMINTIKQRR